MTSHRWKRFFTEAGLPPEACDNYAIIFTENRIRFDMLDELSKDYLSEMGIKKMGDIISILRHAKTVYSNSYREKFFGNNESFQSSVKIAKAINQADTSIINEKSTSNINDQKRIDRFSTIRIVQMPIDTSNNSPNNIAAKTHNAPQITRTIVARNVTGLQSNTTNMVSRKRIEPPSDDSSSAVFRPTKIFRTIKNPSEEKIQRSRVDTQKRLTNFKKTIEKAVTSNLNDQNPTGKRLPVKLRLNNPPLLAKNDMANTTTTTKTATGSLTIKDRIGKKTVFQRLDSVPLTSPSPLSVPTHKSVFNRLGTKY